MVYLLLDDGDGVKLKFPDESADHPDEPNIFITTETNEFEYSASTDDYCALCAFLIRRGYGPMIPEALEVAKVAMPISDDPLRFINEDDADHFLSIKPMEDHLSFWMSHTDALWLNSDDEARLLAYLKARSNAK